MKKATTYFVNFILVLAVVSISFAISTFALSKKIDSQKKIFNKIYGTVEKKETIVISETRGNMDKIYYSVGEEVRRGEKIAKLKNPDLQIKIASLSKFTDNESAQTELEVATNEIKGLDVVSPVNGYIDEIAKSEGEFVNPSDKLFVLFSNEDSRILFYLRDYEYRNLSNLKTISAYSSRLDQYINIKITNFKPRTEKDNNEQNKIGVYFELLNPEDGEKLLHGEDVELVLNEEATSPKRPLDFIIDTWSVFFKTE